MGGLSLLNFMANLFVCVVLFWLGLSRIADICKSYQMYSPFLLTGIDNVVIHLSASVQLGINKVYYKVVSYKIGLLTSKKEYF